MNDAISELSETWKQLPKEDWDFATSLLSQHKKGKALSDKQRYWVEKLAQKGQGIPDFTTLPTGKVAPTASYAGVLALFAKAAAQLKYPKMIFETNGVTVTLKGKKGLGKNGAKSWVNVHAGRGPYLEYAGTICEEHGFKKTSALSAATENSLTTLLAAIDKNPARATGLIGKLSGNCCFCSSKLTDKKSTDVGYGPTCARQWSLPWGVK